MKEPTEANAVRPKIGDNKAGKFGPFGAHPSVNEESTHTDEELLSPEFRSGVEKLKLSIRLAAAAHAAARGGDLDIGTLWAALHEVAPETREDARGEEQAEMYWSKLQEFSDWQMQQPPEGGTARQKCNDRHARGCEEGAGRRAGHREAPGGGNDAHP